MIYLFNYGLLLFFKNTSHFQLGLIFIVNFFGVFIQLKANLLKAHSARNFPISSGFTEQTTKTKIKLTTAG